MPIDPKINLVFRILIEQLMNDRSELKMIILRYLDYNLFVLYFRIR